MSYVDASWFQTPAVTRLTVRCTRLSAMTLSTPIHDMDLHKLETNLAPVSCLCKPTHPIKRYIASQAKWPQRTPDLQAMPLCILFCVCQWCASGHARWYSERLSSLRQDRRLRNAWHSQSPPKAKGMHVSLAISSQTDSHIDLVSLTAKA